MHKKPIDRYRLYRIPSLVADARRRDRKRANPTPKDRLVTTATFRQQVAAQGNRCYYTGVPFDEASPLLQVSIERLDNRVGYSLENTVAVLRGLNMARGEASLTELKRFIQEIKLSG